MTCVSELFKYLFCITLLSQSIAIKLIYNQIKNVLCDDNSEIPLIYDNNAIEIC